jgi:hypothetical protein
MVANQQPCAATRIMLRHSRTCLAAFHVQTLTTVYDAATMIVFFVCFVHWTPSSNHLCRCMACTTLESSIAHLLSSNKLPQLQCTSKENHKLPKEMSTRMWPITSDLLPPVACTKICSKACGAMNSRASQPARHVSRPSILHQHRCYLPLQGQNNNAS